MNQVPVRFFNDELALEGEWLLPEGEPPYPAVVVCHPYPPQGGTMSNHVVLAFCLALEQRSIAAFRFNFRSVGASEGEFTGGLGEVTDVKAALDYVYSSPETDRSRFGLAGYSFGGGMALAAAHEDDRVSRLAVVSAPLSEKGWAEVKDYGERGLFLVGDGDEMIPPDTFVKMTAGAEYPEQYRLIKGANHLMDGYEEEVGRVVAGFFAEGFIKS